MTPEQIAAQRDWIAGILTTADELGYGVAEIGPRRVVLDALPAADRRAQTVIIESVHLTDGLLRAVLKPLR